MAYIKPMGAPDPAHAFDKPTPASYKGDTDDAFSESNKFREKAGLPKLTERKPLPKQPK